MDTINNTIFNLYDAFTIGDVNKFKIYYNLLKEYKEFKEVIGYKNDIKSNLVEISHNQCKRETNSFGYKYLAAIASLVGLDIYNYSYPSAKNTQAQKPVISTVMCIIGGYIVYHTITTNTLLYNQHKMLDMYNL